MILYIYLTQCLIIAICDLKNRIIPDVVIGCGIMLAVLLNNHSHLGLWGSLLGMMTGALSIFIAGCLCFLISPVPALGGGDVKLLGMIGAFWGWEVALITLAIAPFLGSLWAGIMNRTKNAYGVFLIVSSLIALGVKYAIH